jgi:pyruvate/2-oxoglutarate dehydrogenase complex dihydrolipoamide dehydrogenase (E3) component
LSRIAHWRAQSGVEAGLAELLTPDICVIGAGSGGLSVAAAAAAFGASVVLIENGKMGGDCLNYGCVPSKALIAAANRAHQVATAGDFGLDTTLKVAYGRTHRHVHKVIEAIAPNDAKERFAGLGVRVLNGTAAFRNRTTVAVDDAFEIKARRFVIATGSSPAIPPVAGLAETPHLTNETIFDLTELPAHLLVLGAGATGLELAQAFRRLGSAVTVIETARPLAREDAECAAIVIEALAGEGIAIRTGTSVASARTAAGGIELVVKAGEAEETLAGSHLLVAASRVPRTAGLGLEKARVKHTAAGIRVNRRLRTSNSRVYAIGDASGGRMSTHVANYHAGLVIRNVLFRMRAKVRYNEVPRVTYTDPELAQVGLTDEEAKQKGYAIRVLRWPYHDNDRAQAERATRGHVKVVVGRHGRILGATVVGAQAGELIAPWTLAMNEGLKISAMARVVAPYPTLGEMNKRAAMTYFSGLPTSPLVQRLIRWVRRLG